MNEKAMECLELSKRTGMKETYIKLADALRSLCADCFWTGGRCKEPCRDFKRLQAIPAEKVEPIRYASWEIQADDSVRCSRCGLIIHSSFEGEGEAMKRDLLPRRCERCGAHIVFDFKVEEGK